MTAVVVLLAVPYLLVGFGVGLIAATRHARYVARVGPDPYGVGDASPLLVFVGAMVGWLPWLAAWLVYRACIAANDALVRVAGADRVASPVVIERLEQEAEDERAD